MAWIDDAHDDTCDEWADSRPGTTLLIATDPALGLTDVEAETLLEWAGSLRISE